MANSGSEFDRIRDLLHEATIRSLAWDPLLARFTIRFECLRRNIDGSPMADRDVEFAIEGVRVVAISYDSHSVEVRPSSFEPPRRIGAEDLKDWGFRQQEARLAINSPAAVQEMLEGARLDWLHGAEADLAHCDRQITLAFDQWTDFGLPVIRIGMLVGADGFAIASGGIPLSLEDWSRQHEAWWQGWSEHWNAKGGDAERLAGPAEEDTVIPAGDPEPPDWDYRPPDEPAFELEPTDAPAELLAPLRIYFEAQHECDWDRLAAVYPSAELSNRERAEQLRQWRITDFGRWGYPRAVDSWWLEGTRACVVLRGIEHSMAVDGEPAENRETVWSIDLRRRRGEWIIYSQSQGWPDFGSAPKLPASRKPWRRKWRSGKLH